MNTHFIRICPYGLCEAREELDRDSQGRVYTRFVVPCSCPAPPVRRKIGACAELRPAPIPRGIAEPASGPSTSLKSGVPCPCGRWNHQATRGLAVVGTSSAELEFYRADESHCPKCRTHYLLLWHVVSEPRSPLKIRVVGIAPLPKGEQGFRRTLSLMLEACSGEVRLDHDVIGAIVASARAWAVETKPTA